MVEIEDLLQREYDVECMGQVVRMKPIKAWKLKPAGRKGVVIAMFKCPDGKVVRKAIAKVDEEGNIIA